MEQGELQQGAADQQEGSMSAGSMVLALFVALLAVAVAGGLAYAGWQEYKRRQVRPFSAASHHVQLTCPRTAQYIHAVVCKVTHCGKAFTLMSISVVSWLGTSPHTCDSQMSVAWNCKHAC